MLAFLFIYVVNGTGVCRQHLSYDGWKERLPDDAFCVEWDVEP